MYDQPQCPDEMVWDMCNYLRLDRDTRDCKECPRWFEDPDFGPCQQVCYSLAHEAARIALAWQKRMARGEGTYNNLTGTKPETN